MGWFVQLFNHSWNWLKGKSTPETSIVQRQIPQIPWFPAIFPLTPIHWSIDISDVRLDALLWRRCANEHPGPGPSIMTIPTGLSMNDWIQTSVVGFPLPCFIASIDHDFRYWVWFAMGICARILSRPTHTVWYCEKSICFRASEPGQGNRIPHTDFPIWPIPSTGLSLYPNFYVVQNQFSWLRIHHCIHIIGSWVPVISTAYVIYRTPTAECKAWGMCIWPIQILRFQDLVVQGTPAGIQKKIFGG